jgi:hypothetical protein
VLLTRHNVITAKYKYDQTFLLNRYSQENPVKKFMITLLCLVLVLVTAAWRSPSQPNPGILNSPSTETGPDNINPLTGLPAKDPQSLLLPPAMVSITNFPITARPQAGLSYSPIVFEMFTGEGDSRLLALFYGDYPQAAASSNSKEIAPTIGPIRSGRLPYEHLRKLYNGFLVMASAYKTVAANLNQYTNIFGSDSDNINSAMIDVTKLSTIAQATKQKLGAEDLRAVAFDNAAPSGGLPAKTLWLPYSYQNQIFWRFDAANGTYLRYHDDANGTTFSLQTDRLNNEPISYENVVILFATHHAYARTIIDIDVEYIDKMPALLLRDGKMYPIFWTTRNSDYEKKTGKTRPIRFIDKDGNLIPLKPGQTWVQIVPAFTPYHEVIDSQVYFDLKNKPQPGSGIWSIDFAPPPLEPK